MAADDSTLRSDVLAAVLRGTFTLRSGRTSSFYVDKYRFQVLTSATIAKHGRETQRWRGCLDGDAEVSMRAAVAPHPCSAPSHEM